VGSPFLNPFEEPETIDLRERSLKPLPLDGFVGAQDYDEQTETEQRDLSEALKPLEEVRDYQVRLMLLTLIEKEAHFPLQDLTISLNEVGATHRVLTSKPITQRVVWQAVAREGENLSSWTKWWLRMSIWVTSLVLLSSLAMKIASWRHLSGPIVSIAGLPASIPLWLVAGFSWAFWSKDSTRMDGSTCYDSSLYAFLGSSAFGTGEKVPIRVRIFFR
jgi:hypothetical protein